MKTCRRCHDFGDNPDIKTYILNYIKHVDTQIKCDDNVYNQRLNTCDSCEKLVNGMCNLCGCFVLVRAIKKNMTCPYPYLNKWH